jgi:4-hydroxy-3-polyprenylbenzoate decarboxylase
MRYFVAITGASGSILGIRTAQKLLNFNHEVYLTVTRTGLSIMGDEVPGETLQAILSGYLGSHGGDLRVVAEDDFSVPFASGSNPPDAMAIVPCSVGSLGRIAAGVSGNLIERAADVCLKEQRRLILVVRETPLNVIHLRNMEALAVAGAVIMPASPGFYHRPETAGDLVDFIVERAVSLLGETGALSKRWGEKEVIK